VTWDAVVVGGGPAGAAFACFLARRGRAVCVVDRARFPREKPCGEFLSPAGTPLLEDLGVRAAVDAAGAARLEGVRVVAHGDPPVELAFPQDAGAPPWGYSLSRLVLDTILLDAARAAGAAVVEGVRVDEILREPDGSAAGVAGRDATGEAWSAHARLVVGAGGRNCPVARGLGLQRRGRRPRYDLLAHWHAAEALPPACELHIGRDAYVAAAPVENDRLNVNCVVTRSMLQRARDPEAVYRSTLAAHPGIRRWISGTRAEPVVASDVTPLVTSRATADGAILLGDAALFLDPFTGQGLYLALRSAALAAPIADAALAARRPTRAALALYDTARRLELADKWRVSRALQAVLYRPRAVRAVVRALRTNRELAATLAAVTGDLVPARRVWSLGYAARLAIAAR
jgi:flavin-dependent dehydrogenase